MDGLNLEAGLLSPLEKKTGGHISTPYTLKHQFRPYL